MMGICELLVNSVTQHLFNGWTAMQTARCSGQILIRCWISVGDVGLTLMFLGGLSILTHTSLSSPQTMHFKHYSEYRAVWFYT